MTPFAKHLADTLGTPQPLALQEIVPARPSIRIHVVDLPEECERVLVTEGMSSQPMTVPPGGEEFQYAELALRLRDDWPLEKMLEQEEYFWPVRWLRQVAFYPHLNETWLGGPYTIISNDEPPQPLGPGTELSCLLLLASFHPYGRWERPDGQTVVIYDVLPIYTEERDLELNEGLPALLSRLEEYAVSPAMHPRRVNSAILD